ncbi:RNA polymerase sigma factor (sigma-70 family) [Herbihabitans rhizosphaerae]|uniref:RNA polymerase sigma factor (Sigma-70 family) n=1 Tax=Herbihabitans rhizosphaerae TaxID=1872711 RepID=A0A4Q7L1J7_9PSEU|nr:sigma-70 family RNA polymerase sigma factor [Herbihabitans rhizosphaerae]RZS43057.1 RNA polymerase sigma factor (sigma-70 family) [Herbihabitans rhizosphaerae]
MKKGQLGDAGDVQRDAEMTLFFKENLRPLIRYLLRRFGSDLDVDSVVQETFERLWKRWDDITGDRTAYMFTVAKNLAIDRLKKNRPPDAVAEDFDSYVSYQFSSPESYAEFIEIMHAINDMPKSLREPMRWRMRGLTTAEIAEVLGMKQATVTKSINRGRAELSARGLGGSGQRARSRKPAAPRKAKSEAPDGDPDFPTEADSKSAGWHHV